MDFSGEVTDRMETQVLKVHFKWRGVTKVFSSLLRVQQSLQPLYRLSLGSSALKSYKNWLLYVSLVI